VYLKVIGTAIALNILLKIPLVAGCAISIVDVLIILVFYRPSGSMKALRAFEFFVMVLVLGVVVCFAFELSKIKAPVGDVFKGYLPSSTIIQSQAYVSFPFLLATSSKYTNPFPVSTKHVAFSARPSCPTVST